jgi:hypothetical protein
MSLEFAELTAVLEQEIALGEELSANLTAQKAAIVAWDASALLREIECREDKLRALALLEQRRNVILKQLGLPSEPLSLRGLLEQLPSNCPERTQVGSLRERASHIFTRLRAEEHYMRGLMETLLSHIQGALSPLVRDAAPVYTETGATGPKRAPSALVHSKA